MRLQNLSDRYGSAPLGYPDPNGRCFGVLNSERADETSDPETCSPLRDTTDDDGPCEDPLRPDPDTRPRRRPCPLTEET